jgi:rhodanese-related sulfurtransferase
MPRNLSRGARLSPEDEVQVRTLLAIGLAFLFAPQAALAGGPAAQVAPGVVDAATARKLVAGGVKVVDVRTPSEYQAGHVPGAVNIPHDEIGKRSAELGPPSTPILLYCHSGRRSGIAVKTLQEKGFTRLYDLQAYERWVESEPKPK